MPADHNLNANKTDSPSIEVKVKAIEGEFLILETLQKGIMIRWPIKNIPQPLEIGSNLKLELQNSQIKAPLGINANNFKDKDTAMRKLLEELVN
jgi:hypothetical protein